MNHWTVGEGGFIRITFTQPLTGTAEGNESHFTVGWKEYDYVPDGTLVDKSGAVLETYAGETEYELILSMQPLQRFQNAVGVITVTYDGGGTLQGVGGSVEPFSASFTPHDLIPKPNQNPQEHIEIANVAATGTLTRIYYREAKEDEHIEIANISATGVLTYVGDL